MDSQRLKLNDATSQTLKFCSISPVCLKNVIPQIHVSISFRFSLRFGVFQMKPSVQQQCQSLTKLPGNQCC